MTATVKPFDDLIDFIATLAPADVLAFKPSEATINRLQWLLEKERENQLSMEEKEELERYLIQEDLMIIAKARAHLKLRQR